MRSAFTHLLTERMTFDDHMAIDDVLNAAQEWAEGKMHTAAAAQLGTIERNGQPSPAYSRFVALVTTPREDKRWKSLYTLCTHLDQLQGGVHTQHGRFTKAEADLVVRENDRLYREGIIWKGIR